MSTFTTAETKITSRDYKVMHDGAILPFDENGPVAGRQVHFRELSKDKVRNHATMKLTDKAKGARPDAFRQ